MKISLIVVGSIKDKYIKEGISEYLKRLSRFVSLEIIEVPDKSIGQDLDKVKKEEGELILAKIPKNSYVICCDEHGKMLDSPGFADLIDNIYSFHNNHICFIIGGSLGIDESILNKAQYKLSFSKMTFTHQMARLFLLEQLFRAFKILHNEAYHK